MGEGFWHRGAQQLFFGPGGLKSADVEMHRKPQTPCAFDLQTTDEEGQGSAANGVLGPRRGLGHDPFKVRA